MPKFQGSFEQLQDAVASGGFAGEWSEVKDQRKFVSDDGGIVNWWPSTKTINFQGKDPHRSALAAHLTGEKIASYEKKSVVDPSENQEIFVVHGHDTRARNDLELMLRRLGLDPFILINEDGGGLTIIEALEKRIGADPSSKFGIVLMTPDDKGYAIKDGEGHVKNRARQNVVLEMGMLLSSLTRKNVAIIKHVSVEEPSDAQGIIYLPYDNDVQEIGKKLVERLQQAGIKIAPDKVNKY